MPQALFLKKWLKFCSVGDSIIIDRRKARVMPESTYSIGGIKNGISILFFTMKEGVTGAKYRIANRFGKSGYADEEICELPAEKKDEGFS